MILKRSVFILLLFSHALLFAAQVVTVKKISEGEKIIYHPKQGESFRVSIDLNRFSRDANYDIVMRNGKNIYFKNKKQQDDIYFVFNEPVDKGDELFLKVNRGYFIYVTQSVKDLPKSIKKVLRANEKERKTKKISKRKNDKVAVDTKEYCFDENGDVYECTPTPPLQDKDQNISISNTGGKSLKNREKESQTPDFIGLFAKKLQQAYEKIKMTLTSPSVKKSDEKNESIVKRTLPEKEKDVQNKIEKKSFSKNHDENKKIKTPPKELMSQNELIAKKIKLPNPRSIKEPPIIQDSVSLAASVSKPQIKSPSFISKMARHQSNINNHEISKPKFSDTVAKSIPKTVKESEKKIASGEYRPKIKEPYRLSPLDNLNTPVAKPVYKEEPKEWILQRRLKENEIIIPDITPVDISNQKIKKQLYKEPPVIQKPIETKLVEVKKPLPKPKPQIIENEDEAKDRIVITKIIEKKPSPSTFKEDLSERMSDRVLGGGYKETNAMGSVRVKAYDNSKPISAWIEVYQNKKRVKSFYTGRSKAVKLPAGTYILKATYRTGTSKQKKNLGRIRLAKGQSIQKKVIFKIGTLNVIAKKAGKPLYVKVEVYKQGSVSRYAYTFSSRNTGIAHLKLSQGSYKIVVKDRGRSKIFNGVFIKGGALKSVLAEF